MEGPFRAAARAENRVEGEPRRNPQPGQRSPYTSPVSALPPAADIALPAAPSLVARARKAVWVSTDGEIEELTVAEAAVRAETSAPFVCHAPALAARLGLRRLLGLDLLELFAFVRPAR